MMMSSGKVKPWLSKIDQREYHRRLTISHVPGNFSASGKLEWMVVLNQSRKMAEDNTRS